MFSHLGYFQRMNSNLEKLVHAEVTGLIKNCNSGKSLASGIEDF